MEHLRRSNTFHTSQPHVRRGRTWGYRGATSPTWLRKNETCYAGTVKDMQAMKRASKMPNFWVTAGAQHLRTFAHALPKGAESAPHRGGNAREENLEEVSFL
jgi:hypothetical protein